MEETISRIIADLEETHCNQNPPPPLSRSTLEDLQSLLDNNDPELLDQFFFDLSSKSISLSSLLPPLTSTMDSGLTYLSLLSSKVYLSLLLSPNSPVFTLFTPMSFLSLLRSLRRSLKPRPLASIGQCSSSTSARGGAELKKRKGRASKNNNNNRRNTGAGSDEDGNYGSGERERGVFDVRLLFCVLEKLGLALDLIHLNRFPDSLKSLVHTIVEIPVLGIEMGSNAANFNRLADLCSTILRQVLKPDHGEEGETAAEVFKSLTSSILAVKSQARSFALGFVKHLVTGIARKNEGVKRAVVNLPRYLAQKAPEKAEPRGLAVEAIIEIVRAMELKHQVGFVEYVVKMTQGKVHLRLLAVDLILHLMMLLKDPFGMDLDGEVKGSWGFDCLEALIQRCSDSSAAIRARALSNLAQLVGFLSTDDKNCAVLKNVLGLGEARTERIEGHINDILRKRCMDEKANVRRAALVLVTKLTALLSGNFDGIVLKTMGMACSDPLVSIRKAAISALSEAFKTFSDKIVTVEWLHAVPRLITDNESSIQEECENLFLELVLDRISRVGSTGESNLFFSNVKANSLERETEMLFPEGVLVLLKEICNGEVMPWVRKICTNLGKKKRLKPKLANALQSIIKTSESLWLSHSKPIEKWTAPPGAWFLLSEVSAHLSKAVAWEFLHHHWQLLDKFGAAGGFNKPPDIEIMHEDEEGSESNSVAWAGDRVFLLQTISNVSVELPPESAADLAHNLLKRIEEFNMHSTEVNAHVKALRTLCRRKALNPEEADALVMKWVQQVFSKASKILEKFISGDLEANSGNSFFTPPRSESTKSKKAAATCHLLSESVTAVYTIGSLVTVCPSADVSTILPLLQTIITSGNSHPNLSKLPGPSVSLKQIAPPLYIQAWLTMGKICLADGKLAKRYIPLFVQELDRSDCAALRNNLIVTMADFCVRYTALVDCYISKITKCLRDPCELVRRQTFILLSRLLQRDYVKWRGVLFLRFLLSLVDESEKIRQLADFLFGNILKVKAPLLAYNSFVESIYVLNDCNAHNGSKNSLMENRLFSIRGSDENSRSKRMHVYVSLLKQMAPEHLLATFAKLCAEILAAASDGMLNIEDITGQSVLQDTFQILACKEIRIPTGRGSQTDTGDIEEEGGDGGASAAAAKGRAITQAIRKGLIQNTIPIFIELKRLLESKNSPLIGSLMECLRILLKDYKNEIDEILVADKQLQKELIYDMQKYESAKARITAAEAVATMQNPSTFLSPRPPNTASRTETQNNFTEKLHNDSRVASAMADAAAAAKARSVLKEVNKGTVTPPLSSISVPKLKSNQGANGAQNDRPLYVLESLRRRQSFNSDDES
ncbi:condensin-2 complex subunit D3 [Jatropha curcas]|uniref:condensin-2 complex subunit D3 n=1 Tax=Jatropha curcas TaxID=180498 RepID=UPI0005FACA0F|nr:condensin-2 complex subunit D3 [Jatropha curcas]